MPIKIKLADFHHAKWMGEGSGLGTQVGTLAYVAPEMRGSLDADSKVSKRYDNKVDMWSLGIVLHEILTKAHPFHEPGRSEFSQRKYQGFLRNGGFPVSLSGLNGMSSPYGRSLVGCMLARHTVFRPTPNEALNHQWFKNHIGPPYSGLGERSKFPSRSILTLET